MVFCVWWTFEELRDDRATYIHVANFSFLEKKLCVFQKPTKLPNFPTLCPENSSATEFLIEDASELLTHINSLQQWVEGEQWKAIL